MGAQKKNSPHYAQQPFDNRKACWETNWVQRESVELQSLQAMHMFISEKKEEKLSNVSPTQTKS